MAFVVDSIKKALPSRPRTRRCPACPALKLPLVLLLLPTAQEPGGLVGKGDAVHTGEAVDAEVAEAKVSGPILKYGNTEIREATGLERKEMINPHLAHTVQQRRDLGPSTLLVAAH